MSIRVVGGSDQGLVRKNNEDSYTVLPVGESAALLIVADGVGGHAFGEVASQITVAVFEQLVKQGKLDAGTNDHDLREMLLSMAAHKAHVDVSKKATEDKTHNGMACTLTGVLCDSSSYTLVQVGDSRLYHFGEKGLTKISEDQTVAQELLAAGRISPAQYDVHPDKGVLSQSIGLESIDQPLEAVVTTHEWQKGDVLVACSDGLSDMVSDESIEKVLHEQGAEPAALIQAALDRGGKDNVTVAIAVNQ